MSAIIPPRDEKENKEKLTAGNFYPQWAGEHWMEDHSMVKNFDQWLEFAQAYALEFSNQMNQDINWQRELIQRAAELLKSFHYTANGPVGKKVNQWLRDARVEK